MVYSCAFSIQATAAIGNSRLTMFIKYTCMHSVVTWPVLLYARVVVYGLFYCVSLALSELKICAW